jgi:integrase
VCDNVASLVEVPRHRAKEIQPLTPKQARTLLQASKDDRLCALVSVATALGLRLGEALGLEWDGIDVERLAARPSGTRAQRGRQRRTSIAHREAT